MSDAPGQTAAPAAPTATDAPPAAPATPTPADVAAQQAATPPAQPAAPATDANAPQSPEGFADWPQAAQDAWSKAQRENARLIKENGDQRIQAKAKAADEGARKAALALARALGADIPDDEAPGMTVEQAQAIATDTKREAALTAAAWAEGVKPEQAELLAFKVSRNADAKALDPNAADFGDKMRAVVRGLIAADASLVGQQVQTPTTSTELGGANSADQITPEAFARMSIAQKSDLFKSDPAAYARLTGNGTGA